MSQTKQLIGIWGAALVVGVASFAYMNHTIDTMLIKSVANISAAPVHGQQRIVVGPNVQQASVYDTYLLQPAMNGEQPEAVNPQADNNFGGNGQNTELQPAAGYGAMHTVIQ